MAMEKIGDAYLLLSLRDADFMSSFDRISRSISKHSDKYGRMGAVGAAAFSVIATGIIAATAAAAKFEYQMKTIERLLSEVERKGIGFMAKSVKQLSVKFGQSTANMTRALYDVLSAMIPVNKSLYVLNVASELAVSSFTDVRTTGDAVTTMLNSYALAASNAGDISNWLWAVVRRGKITMQELAPVIGIIAPSAGIAGIKLEELGAAISTVTRTGMRAPRAMTAIIGLLRAFMRPLKSTRDMGEKLGITMDQNTIRVLGLTGVFRRLKNATAEQLGELIPTIRGYRAAAAILKNYNAFLEDIPFITDRASLSTDKFRIVSESLEFKLKQNLQALIGIAREIGEGFLPAMNKAASVTLSVGAAFSIIPQGVKTTIAVVGGLALAITGLAATVGILKWSFVSLGITKILSRAIIKAEALSAVMVTMSKVVFPVLAVAAAAYAAALYQIGVMSAKATREMSSLVRQSEINAANQQRILDLRNKIKGIEDLPFTNSPLELAVRMEEKKALAVKQTNERLQSTILLENQATRAIATHFKEFSSLYLGLKPKDLTLKLIESIGPPSENIPSKIAAKQELLTL